jgi:muramoyltetrapeptide carboxypeptidase LdcA involved in peptidoglycan recycling
MVDVAATRFGAPLPDGGTIGVCAPSGPYFNASDVYRPKEWWESKGYTVRLLDGVWSKDDYEAGPAEKRAEDLHTLFADPEVDVIQVLWGGTGAIRILPHLDFDLIAANPKALMGFSDITNLHVALRQRSGLATLHGPGLGSMGYPERTEFTWESARAAFRTGPRAGPGRPGRPLPSVDLRRASERARSSAGTCSRSSTSSDPVGDRSSTGRSCSSKRSTSRPT